MKNIHPKIWAVIQGKVVYRDISNLVRVSQALREEIWSRLTCY